MVLACLQVGQRSGVPALLLFRVLVCIALVAGVAHYGIPAGLAGAAWLPCYVWTSPPHVCMP